MTARENAMKIRALMDAQGGHADLYRTIEAGPSGQRAQLLVGRIRYLSSGPDEFEVRDPRSADLVGYARRTVFGEWSMTRYDEFDGYRWAGYASSLSVGVDVLVNGEHAALGRHDSRRTSSGSIRKGPVRPSAAPKRPNPLAVCEFCGDPVAGVLADCPKPDCQHRSLDVEMAFVRCEDV